MELFTVTERGTKKLVSVPLNHVVALAVGRWEHVGTVITTAGRTVETVETYSELVHMWMDLTGTGDR